MNKLKKSLEVVKKNQGLLVFSALLDVLFFIFYGFLTAPFFETIVRQINFLGTTLQSQAAEYTRTFANNPSIINLLFTDPVLKPSTYELLTAYLIVGLIIYALYVSMQSVNWTIARTMVGKKEEVGKYMKKFAKVNITWFLLFVVYHFIDVIASLKATVQAGEVITQPTNALGIFAIIFLILIGYFALISYNVLDVKKSFKEGRKLKKHLPVFLIIAAVFLILNYILTLTPKLGAASNFLIGIILVLPAITWARVYLTENGIHS